MIETFELLMKSCAKFDLLFVNIQCATACSLEKVNFKVKSIVSVEPSQPFQIRTTVAELQHFFLGTGFYWRTLYVFIYK